MRLFFGSTIVVLLAILLAGCARFPTTTTPTDIPPRTLYAEMTVNSAQGGRIDPNNYYFLAIGIDQTDVTGPVPVVTGPELTNGWGTISPLPGNEVQQPPFFVVVHGGSFAQYRDNTYLGEPFRYGITDDNRTVWVEIDQREIEPLLGTVASPIIQLNWITMLTLTAPIDPIPGSKQYDGFGLTGNSYLHPVPLTVSGIFSSGTQLGAPFFESTYGPDETTTSDPDIDIAAWRVEVRIR